MVDSRGLCVKNALNPFISKCFLFKDINKFKQVRATFYGNAIQIFFNDGKVKTYPINIKRLRLERIVQDLNSKLIIE